MINMIKGKIEQATRLVFVNSLTFLNKSVIIVEYPKSGGSWLGQLISDYLEIPFPRNKLPGLTKSVYHSHYQPKYLIPRNNKILWLVRDGRDVYVSFYYHQLIWSDKNKLDPKTVTYTRKQLRLDDYYNVKKNMPKYLEYSFTHTPPKTHYFNFPGNWANYNNKWIEEFNNRGNIYLLKYEDLLRDTESTLRSLLSDFFEQEINEQRLAYVVHKFSFENQTKRKKGDEDSSSFLRKGVAGDWKNYFNEDAKKIFKTYAGKELIDLGYEDDFNW